MTTRRRSGRRVDLGSGLGSGLGSRLVAELQGVAVHVVGLARRAGADASEVIVRDGAELTAKVRLGEPELVQEAGSRALGLRVFKDGRAATTYTSDLRDDALALFVTDTVKLAELSEPDELNRLPDARDFAKSARDLHLFDPASDAVDAAYALRVAKQAEAAALAFDARVNNSEGATWTRNVGAVAFANSAGFSGGYRGSYAALYVQPICDDEDGKKRNGYWWTADRFLANLDDPEHVGCLAAERTLAQLGARKVDTCEVPVIFEPEAGRAIPGMVFSVANGSAFYRKSSYLVGREGTRVASDLVTLVDDPLIPGAPGSRPFDGDGLATRKNTLIDKGTLKTILCDVYSARKLGRRSTGSAGRGVGGNPSPTTSNLVMRPGKTPPAQIVADTERGLYVTSMMGFGFNPVTGDFSRGASGFWIENGELAFPVTEVTISANFDDLLQRIDRVGNDLDTRAATQVPTFRVSHMTLAGR
jgi:PmbA protein